MKLRGWLGSQLSRKENVEPICTPNFVVEHFSMQHKLKF